ncbi:unnamed protein product [Gongylonema pulchrum]|uniref:Uncharacterized protein n=1 Tax=Gongylonema pulchrum TaxID=637853 RepID=A0A183DNS9_9BILA|nr:unnamed protein product [Gongylonema pulchrum]
MCINATWSATIDDDVCWDGTQIVDNTEVDVGNSSIASDIGSNFTTSVFLNERLKLLILSNRLLESYEPRRFYNESVDSEEVEASAEIKDAGSGSDENLPPVVVDIAGSHRDVTETPTLRGSIPKTTSSSSISSSGTSTTRAIIELN